MEKSPRGRICIDVLGLNREGLPEMRRREYEFVRRAIRAAQLSLKEGSIQAAADLVDELLMVHEGKMPFSMAGRKAITDNKQQLQKLMEEVSQ